MHGSSHRSVAAWFLGTWALTVHGVPAGPWRAGKAVSLVRYLLVNHDRLISAERLQNLLWPHRPTADRSVSLRVAVHAVRRGLGGGACNAYGAQLISRDGGYELCTSSLWLDFEEFVSRAAAARAAASAGNPLDTQHACEAALTLYQGPFLPGVDADWALDHREWLRTLAMDVVTHLHRAAEAAGDPLLAAQVCHRALRLDPYGTEYRALIGAYRQQHRAGSHHPAHASTHHPPARAHSRTD